MKHRRAYWCDIVQEHVHFDSESESSEIDFNNCSCNLLIFSRTYRPMCLRTEGICKISRKAVDDLSLTLSKNLSMRMGSNE